MASTSILPKRLQPMLATLTDGPFDDNDCMPSMATSKADHPVFRGEDVKPGLCEAALLKSSLGCARYDLADDL